MSEYCKGCLVPGPHGINQCFSRGFNRNGECPCTECLVKVTCVGDCDNYSVYAKDITKMKKNTADEDVKDIGVMINLSKAIAVREAKKDGRKL